MLRVTITEENKSLNLLLSDKWRECASPTKPLLQLKHLSSSCLQILAKHTGCWREPDGPVRSDKSSAAAHKP